MIKNINIIKISKSYNSTRYEVELLIDFKRSKTFYFCLNDDGFIRYVVTSKKFDEFFALDMGFPKYIFEYLFKYIDGVFFDSPIILESDS